MASTPPLVAGISGSSHPQAFRLNRTPKSRRFSTSWRFRIDGQRAPSSSIRKLPCANFLSGGGIGFRKARLRGYSEGYLQVPAPQRLFKTNTLCKWRPTRIAPSPKHEDALVRYCFYTTAVVVTEDDPATADANAQEVLKQFQHHGFDARIENINANEAFLGSLPGHGHYNVRRPLLHSRNLADLLPLTSAWPGEERNPCPFIRKQAVTLYAATTGATPFRLNLHVGDVGHTLVSGRTGSGKSTVLALLMAQFFRLS